MLLKSVGTIVFNLILFSVAAQEEQMLPVDSTISTMREIIVTAQRTNQQKLFVPYSVSSISKLSFQKFQPRTTPESLIGVAGVFVQKTNHGGGSAIIRGLTGNQTLLLIDGIRMNNSTFRYGPNQYLNTIDAFAIQKIEVAKGTGSVQYGTDAMGGVLQVFTKEPQFITGKPVYNSQIYGKFVSGNMEKTIRGETSLQHKKFGMMLGVTRRVFGDLIGGDTTGKQSPSGYNEYAFDIKSKFLLHPQCQLIVASQLLQQNNVPVYHKVLLENYSLNEMNVQLRLLSYAKLYIETNSSIYKNINVNLSYQKSKEGRHSQKMGTSIYRSEEDEVNTIGLTSEIYSEINKFWTINSGLEIYHDLISSLRNELDLPTQLIELKRGLYPDHSTYQNISIYSLHHFQFQKWKFDGGIRYNYFVASINDSNLGDVKIRPSALVGNIAVLLMLKSNQSIYITLSNGFRAPNIDDMGTLGIVDFRYEIPSVNLKPEKSVTSEIGYKFQSKRFNGSAAVYNMRLKNLITRIRLNGEFISGYQVYQKENIEDASIRGFETELNWQASNYFKIHGSMVYTYGINKTKAEPLRRIPPFHGNFQLSYNLQKWFLSSEFVFAFLQNRLAQGDIDDNRIPDGGTPGWSIFNLYVGYKLSKINFNTGIQNAFNKDYRTHGSGINGVGRSVFFSIAIKI